MLQLEKLYAHLLEIMTMKGIVDDDQPVLELSIMVMPELFQVLGYLLR
eukprot:COSAG06_NODE_2834_length_6204_cov_12.577396_8_plen_48_part_00